MGMFFSLYEMFIQWLLELFKLSILHYGCPASNKTAKLQVKKKLFKF